MINGISSMATRQVLADLAQAYEGKSGVRVAVESVGGVDAARRVQDREAFDFVVLAAEAIGKLADAGRVDGGSRTDVARSGIALAFATGASRPDVSSESAARDAVARARSVGYSTGPSGTHLIRLFERWGISPRLVQAPPGVPVGTLVARGEVELGFQQLSELIHVPGIEVIAELPPEVQLATVFSAGVCSASGRSDETRAFVAFLASPEAAAAKRRHGMEPA